jgi:hypothetical protein
VDVSRLLGLVLLSLGVSFDLVFCYFNVSVFKRVYFNVNLELGVSFFEELEESSNSFNIFERNLENGAFVV